MSCTKVENIWETPRLVEIIQSDQLQSPSCCTEMELRVSLFQIRLSSLKLRMDVGIIELLTYYDMAWEELNGPSPIGIVHTRIQIKKELAKLKEGGAAKDESIDELLRGTFGEDVMEFGGSIELTPVGETGGPWKKCKQLMNIPALNTEDACNNDIVCVQPPKTWTPCVEHKPYKGQLFPSFEDAFGFYKEYARKSGFEIRKATTEISLRAERLTLMASFTFQTILPLHFTGHFVLVRGSNFWLPWGCCCPVPGVSFGDLDLLLTKLWNFIGKITTLGHISKKNPNMVKRGKFGNMTKFGQVRNKTEIWSNLTSLVKA
ncbi:hypothetical protein LXL04_012241 [Taraxacum kok-saghyz]